jgi:hypothetical protein
MDVLGQNEAGFVLAKQWPITSAFPLPVEFWQNAGASHPATGSQHQRQDRQGENYLLRH